MSSTRGLLDLAPALPGAAVATEGHDPGPLVARTMAQPPPGGDAPGGPDQEGARSVIGSDDRTRVVDTAVFPSSAIGRLSYVQQGRSLYCTAFLVDADTVMTAGHCVHAGGTGIDQGWSSDLVFTPAQNGTTGVAAPFGSCRGTEAYTVPEWADGEQEWFDLGWVDLDCAVGTEVGWLAVGPGPGGSGTGTPVHVRGYPAGKPTGTQWTAKSKVTASSGTLLFHQADTFGGQSGSPVFNWRGCGAGASGVCAVAVHGYGLHGDGAHRNHNHGARITADRAALTAAVAAG